MFLIYHTFVQCLLHDWLYQQQTAEQCVLFLLTNQQMRFYKYIQPHVITFDQYVLIIPATIIKVSYKCTVIILFTVQKYKSVW